MNHSSFVLFSDDTTDFVIYPATFVEIPHGISITHVDGTWLPGYPLRIDSSWAGNFLYPFFNQHIDKDMLPLCHHFHQDRFDEFGWNLFSRSGFSAMLDDIDHAIRLLAEDEYEHPLITAIAQHFTPYILDQNIRNTKCLGMNLRLLQSYKKELTIYYRDFHQAVSQLMNEYPDCNWFCIQGP